MRLVVEVSDDVATGYGDIRSRLGVTPDAFLTMMAEGLVEQDAGLVSKGRGGLGTFRPPGWEDYALERTVEHGIYPATSGQAPGWSGLPISRSRSATASVRPWSAATWSAGAERWTST